MGESPRPVLTNQTDSTMGLRFSILGFAQDRALAIRAMQGDKELKLDILDLLLLNQVADFPNRSNTMKIIEDDKIFFWMSYAEFLEELPILNLKKQALRDRFDKLVTLGLLEKKVSKMSNMTFFRLTEKYECLKYSSLVYDADRGCVVNEGGVYSTTQGVCTPLHTISEYNNNIITKEKEYKEKESCDVNTMPTPAEHTITYAPRNKSVSSEELSGMFEDLWLLYERKGSKAAAKKEFAKLSEEEIAAMRSHIPAYLQSRPERQYRQDFERYIKHKTFTTVVYSKHNEILYDPEAAIISVTHEELQEFSEVNDSFTINGVSYR